MTPAPTLSRADFESLLAQHQVLIGLVNELEYHLYRLGEGADTGHVSECQQAAGALIGALRAFLYQHDQIALPVLDAVAHAENSIRPGDRRLPEPATGDGVCLPEISGSAE